MIEQLRRQYPHSIQQVSPAIAQHFTCFACALGLHSSPAYFRVASLSYEPNVFANTPFVMWLLQERALISASCNGGGEKVVIYFNEGSPAHAGRLQGGRVTSKWGTGKFFEHDVWEVPANYGDRIECFLLPNLQLIESSFLRFASKQGVDLEELGLPNHGGG